MKVIMDFNREHAEITVAMALMAPRKVTRNMTDEELVEKACWFAKTYGFSNAKIISEGD